MALLVLIAGAGAVVAVDQGAKLIIVRYLHDGAISLGPLGRIQIVLNRVWLEQIRGSFGLEILWGCWACSTIIVTLFSVFVPAGAPFGALLIGGSVSHLFETTYRGAIRDYVGLRFWPPFNFADVAIAFGAFGLAVATVQLFCQHIA